MKKKVKLCLGCGMPKGGINNVCPDCFHDLMLNMDTAQEITNLIKQWQTESPFADKYKYVEIVQ